MQTFLAVAFLASLPVGAVRALSWLLQSGTTGGTGRRGTHAHVWRRQLRWREQQPDTFEEGYACQCGRWRQPGKV